MTSEESTENTSRPELGHMAQWTVSSHKYGFGVDNLRDDNDATYWQSEGPQPHIIDLSFPKRVFISAVAILTSHPKDDSYTPSKVAVRCGTSLHDLVEVRTCVFEKPNGWQHIAVRPMDNSGTEVEGPPIPAHHLRVTILANHLNGKDTHVRGLRVFGSPAQQPLDPSGLGVVDAGDDEMMEGDGRSDSRQVEEGKKLLTLGHDGLSGFTSQAFRMHEGIR